MTRVLPSSLVLCLLALLATRAAADPAAEQLFRDGRQLLKDGQVDLACEKFEQSRAVEARFGTLLNLADCRERQGKLATAWELFLEARALAARQKDAVQIAEAERRAAAIAGKRAYLTVVIAKDHRVPGLVVTRNGVDVPQATWDQELPIDPGSYVIEAKAAGYKPAVVTVEVKPQAHAGATVPALVEDATSPPVDKVPGVTPSEPPPPVDRVAPPPRTTVEPPIRRGALGLALGASSDGDLTPGFRAIGQLEAGPGAFRGIFNFQYARMGNDPSYSGDNSNLFAFGLGLDYLWAWKPGLASAAGIGGGLDLFQGGYNDAYTNEWKAVRASPIIVRMRSRPLEVGLHGVLIVQSKPVLITTVAVDWFIW